MPTLDMTPLPRSWYWSSWARSVALVLLWMPPMVPVPWIRIGSLSDWPNAEPDANSAAMRAGSSFLLIFVSPYRVKNLPRLPGALDPWIAEWQSRHARATRRVLTLGWGCPVRAGAQCG